MTPDKSQLSEKQLLILQSEMAMRRKSTVIAYLIFLLPTGWFGGHHWYLRHLGRSLLYIFCGMVFVGALVKMGISNTKSPQTGSTIVAVVGLIGYWLMLLFDAISIVWQVGGTNRRIEREIIDSLTRK